MSFASTYWPLFGLRIRTPNLELRIAEHSELEELARVAAAGVHDPEYMPFSHPWTDRESPELERELLQWNWRARAEWTPDQWHLILVVFLDGRPIGSQDVSAKQFAISRHVFSGSWLGRAHQGKGYGKEMRAGMLHLAFEGLGALVAESEARTDNQPSISVSKALGYVENGSSFAVTRGERVETIRFRLTREAWEVNRKFDVRIEGLDQCLDMFIARAETRT